VRTKYEIVVGSVPTNYEIVNELAAFSPASGPPGAFRANGGLTLQSAQQTFPLICSLVKAVSLSLIEPQPIETLFPAQASSNGTAELATLFNQYGSDKSSVHNYHLVYAPLLAPRRSDPLRLLEIGLGTNDPHMVSTMGPSGKPGASHLADGMFDLMIDDGLHSPNANIATMLFALKILRPSGIFIVEDINSSSMPIWQVVAALLPENYNPKITQTKSALSFMIKKAA
jgi:hypothetical protein